MSKPKLIYRVEDYPNFSQGWIKPLVDPYFEITVWEPGTKYSPADTVLTTYQQDFLETPWFYKLEQQGNPVVVDHLFDSDVDSHSIRLSERKLELRSPHWMWYRTAILAAHHHYDQYRPQRSYTHDFLCLMNKIRDHRDRVMTDLAAELETARWSYVDRGHDIGDPEERNGSIFWEYYMNPQWYNSTCWHLVVESWVRSDVWFRSPSWPNYKTEISEKSYKPLAFFQPMIVLGSVDTLKFLRSQGFETFDNLWSEQYDSIESDAKRVDTVLAQVREVVRTYNRHWSGWDSVTEQKLAHNHARFFDLATVKQRFDTEIMGTIREFLNL